MDWENISIFLEKFKNIKIPTDFLGEEVVNSIKQTLGIELKIEDVKIRGKNIYLKVNNFSAKNKIFIEKNKVLSFLKQKLGDKAPNDIYFG